MMARCKDRKEGGEGLRALGMPHDGSTHRLRAGAGVLKKKKKFIRKKKKSFQKYRKPRPRLALLFSCCFPVILCTPSPPKVVQNQSVLPWQRAQ